MFVSGKSSCSGEHEFMGFASCRSRNSGYRDDAPLEVPLVAVAGLGDRWLMVKGKCDWQSGSVAVNQKAGADEKMQDLDKFGSFKHFSF